MKTPVGQSLSAGCECKEQPPVISRYTDTETSDTMNKHVTAIKCIVRAALSLSAVLLCLARASAAPPPPPPGYHWVLTWSEEFSGTQIDTSKWDVMGDYARRSGAWCKAYAYLDGAGHLVIKTAYDSAKGTYCSGAIQTKEHGPNFTGFYHRFGYYEASLQFPDSPSGHWPAFWTFADSVQDTGDQGQDGTEMDFMEYWAPNTMSHWLHWNGYGSLEGQAYHYVPTSSVKLAPPGYHTIGAWWKPNEYRLYVDDKQTWTANALNGVSQVPEFLMITDEVEDNGYGSISGATLPDYYYVDYVRVYDLVPDNGSYASIQFISASHGSNGSGAKKLNLQTPASVTPGTFLLAYVVVNVAGNTIESPTGWAPITRQDASGFSTITYYRIATANEPASYNWSLNPYDTSNYEASGGIIAYSGVDVDNPLDSKTTSTSQTATASSPGVITTLANDLLVYLVGLSKPATVNTPSSMTLRWAGSSSALTSAAAFDKTIASPGASGSISTTVIGANANASTLIALRPAFLPPPPPTPPPVSRGNIAFKSATSAQNGAGGSSLTLNRPQGLAAGDLLIAYVAVEYADNTVSPPVGWVMAARQSTSEALSSLAYYRIATSNEPASYTWTFSESAEASGGIAVYTGVDSSDPLDKWYVYGEEDHAVTTYGMLYYSSNVNSYGITTTVANARLIFMAAVAAATTVNPPSGMTAQFTAKSSTSTTATLFDASVPNAGATGPISTSHNGGDNSNVSILMALKPAPTSGALNIPTGLHVISPR